MFGETCRSWYKAGKEEGRVVAIYPGMHGPEPRWTPILNVPQVPLCMQRGRLRIRAGRITTLNALILSKTDCIG